MRNYLRVLYERLLLTFLKILDYIEASTDWQTRVQWTNTCIWAEDETSAGICLIAGEENRLGKRRLRILVRPEKPWNVKHTPSWYKAMIWVSQPRLTHKPRPKLTVVK